MQLEGFFHIFLWDDFFLFVDFHGRFFVWIVEGLEIQIEWTQLCTALQWGHGFTVDGGEGLKVGNLCQGGWIKGEGVEPWGTARIPFGEDWGTIGNIWED